MRRSIRPRLCSPLALRLLVVPAGASPVLAQPDAPALTSVETEREELSAGPNVGRQPRRPWDHPSDADDPQAPDADALGDAADEAEDPSRLHVWLGVDAATAYVSRGFVWEDSGLILQPWGDLWFDVLRGEEATLSLTAGTWSSFHSQATWAGTSDEFREHWYELDLYVGAAVEAGAWVLEGRYNWYTSPSDAWDTIEEITLSAAFDDSEWLGEWALQPTALIAIETGSAANDGYDNGVYLQLGIEPGFGLDGLGLPAPLGDAWVSLPISIGLSLDDYYESEDDDGPYEDVFGFASAGAAIDIPLNAWGGSADDADASWGTWNLTLGVQVVWMGDAAASFNDGDEIEVVGMIGIGVEF
ncbi:MAG: hypothetical protein H6809_03465 [Phycisphaeraceae bacterium]|nr:hypothetical protein [Phycisphaeraceae bacterium]